MSIIKLLKIALPLATATSATIATTFLVSSFNRKDEVIKEEDLDNFLTDLKLPDEKFEDIKKFYAEDGTGDGQKPIDEEVAKKISEILEKTASLEKLNPENLNEQLKTLEQEIEKLVSSEDSNNESQDFKDTAEDLSDNSHKLQNSLTHEDEKVISETYDVNELTIQEEEGTETSLPLTQPNSKDQVSPPNQAQDSEQENTSVSDSSDSTNTVAEGDDDTDAQGEEDTQMQEKIEPEEQNLEAQPETRSDNGESNLEDETQVMENSGDSNSDPEEAAGNKEKLTAEEVEK